MAAQQVQLRPADDMILVTFVEFREITAPSPDPDDEIAVILRMLFCILQHPLVFSPQESFLSDAGFSLIDIDSQDGYSLVPGVFSASAFLGFNAVSLRLLFR